MGTIRGWVVLSVSLAVGLTSTATAHAEIGDLSFGECITGELLSGPAPDGSGSCLAAPGISAAGSGSGLGGARAIAISPDNRWLYAGTGNDASVATFKRDPKKGKLTFKRCISGETEVVACQATSGATSAGVNSGMADIRSVAISPDGRSLYASSFDDAAISHFKRNIENGKLTYKGCFTGETESSTGAGGTCNGAPAATSSGTSSGLAGLRDVEVSPNGKTVYAVAEEDDAVATFTRNKKSGALTYSGCVTGDLAAGPQPTGTGACAAVPSATVAGADSGFDDLFALTLSPDGESLYTVAAEDDAIALFAPDRSTGALTYEGCITGEEQSGPSPGSEACAAAGPITTDDGVGSALDAVVAVRVSPQGHALYTAAAGDDAVTVFERDEQSGELTFMFCFSGRANGSGCESVGAEPSGVSSGLHRMRDLALSSDGRSLYTASQDDDAVAIFTTSPTVPGLGYRGCITGNLLAGPVATGGSGSCTLAPDHMASNGASTGLDSLQAVAVSPDGRSLYSASLNDSAISRLKRVR